MGENPVAQAIDHLGIARRQLDQAHVDPFYCDYLTTTIDLLQKIPGLIVATNPEAPAVAPAGGASLPEQQNLMEQLSSIIPTEANQLDWFFDSGDNQPQWDAGHEEAAMIIDDDNNNNNVAPYVQPHQQGEVQFAPDRGSTPQALPAPVIVQETRRRADRMASIKPVDGSGAVSITLGPFGPADFQLNFVQNGARKFKQGNQFYDPRVLLPSDNLEAYWDVALDRPYAFFLRREHHGDSTASTHYSIRFIQHGEHRNDAPLVTSSEGPRGPPTQVQKDNLKLGVVYNFSFGSQVKGVGTLEVVYGVWVLEIPIALLNKRTLIKNKKKNEPVPQ